MKKTSREITIEISEVVRDLSRAKMILQSNQRGLREARRNVAGFEKLIVKGAQKVDRAAAKLAKLKNQLKSAKVAERKRAAAERKAAKQAAKVSKEANGTAGPAVHVDAPAPAV